MAEVRAAVKANDEAQRCRFITANCQGIVDRFGPTPPRVRLNLNVRKALAEGPWQPTESLTASREVIAQAKSSSGRLKAFKDAWSAEGEKARDTAALDEAADTLVALANRLEEQVRGYWAKEVAALRHSFVIDAPILQAQRLVPGCEQDCDAYQSVLTEFDGIAKAPPQEAGTLAEIILKAERLVAIKGRMNFNQPEEIKAFFKRLDLRPDGIALGEIPPSVLVWLGENNLLNEFLVFRRRR